MGKTVGAILTVVAAVAVNVIPGVGQAISGALISAGLAATAASSLAASLLVGVTLAGVQSVLGLFSGGTKAAKPETTERAVKSSIPVRTSAYGRSRLYGAYVLYETTAAGRAIDVLAVHDGLIDGIEQRYLADDAVTLTGGSNVAALPDGRYGINAVQWYEQLGFDNEIAFPALLALSDGKWTADHRGDGVAMIAVVWRPVKSDRFSEIYPGGGPVAASIAARWQKVFDWRDPTQSVYNPGSWKWSENAILHLAHYRLTRELAYRLPGAIRPTPAALVTAWNTFFEPTKAYWTTAANVADEDVPLAAGGTEKRYRSCFSHTHNTPHKDAINDLTLCADAWVSPRADGALVVFAGKYSAPTIEIGPAEIISFEWQSGIEDENEINELKLSYISAEHDFTEQEATPWQDADRILAAGQIRSDPLNPAVPSHGQVRRLAKRRMARVTAPFRGTVTTNVAGRKVRGHRYVTLRLVDAGTTFYEGPVEIVQATRDVAQGGVTFAWVAADPNIDAWNPLTEEGQPAPSANRIAPAPLDPPVITAAATLFVNSGDETTGTRVQINATGPARQDIIYFARWRTVGAAVWNEQRYPDQDTSLGPVEIVTGLVPTNASLEVALAYQIGDGRQSPYTAAYPVSTNVDAVAPDAAAAVTLLSWGESMVLSTPAIARASTYRWRIFAADGVTLIRTITTTTREATYSKALAAADGVRRVYVVDVAGVNAAGVGAVATSGLLTNAAPPAVTGVVGAGGATIGQVSFDLLAGLNDLAGYMVAYSLTPGFDPVTTGFVEINQGASPHYIYGLAAGTYYAKVAGFDVWNDNPGLLNFSAETSFVISAGGGGSGGGGEPGGGGGGYCVTTDAQILMADRSLKAAGDLQPGDRVRTQHEQSLEWGEYDVLAVETVPCEDVWQALGVKGSGDHRVYVNGWKRLRDIGERVNNEPVVRITVAFAHTYYSNGVLSHNAKNYDLFIP